MSSDQTELSVDDLKNFKKDGRGRLYWAGRRVKTAGWTVSETAAVASAVFAAVMALIVALAEYDTIERTIQRALDSAKGDVEGAK